MISKKQNNQALGLSLILSLVLLAACSGRVDVDALRAGEVVSTRDIGAVTFVLAKDNEGRSFWVMTNLCTIGEGGRIEVLEGTRYPKIRSEDLGRTLNDVYSARLIRIDGRKIKGFGNEDLPANCIDLR